MAQKIKLAVIGAGAIAEILHLPAAKATDGFELAAIFDFNVERAQQLALVYGIPLAAANYKDHLGTFEAAIVATPNSTHAAISIDLMKAGKHVLVEKPAAFSVAQLQEMIEAEKTSNAVVSVAQVKRFYPMYGFIKKALQEGSFGQLKRIDIQYSVVYSYPMASDSFLRKETAGGGVFFDMGVHYLDLIYWWLGHMEVASYKDDAEGGLDASAHLEMLAGTDKVPVSLTLGRLRNMPSFMKFEFEHCTFQILATYGGGYSIHTLAGKLVGDLEGLAQRKYLENGIDQLTAFQEAIVGQRAPVVSLQDARKVIELIEQAYAQKQPIQYEWEQVEH